jgi:hypothetical protein
MVFMAVEREGISVRVFRSFAEEQAADREWWRQIPPDERVELALRLSEDLYRMLGKLPDEDVRLRRSVASIRRA